MKKLAAITMDITDELLAGDAATLERLITDLPESVKTASIPSAQEQAALSDENVAVILFHPHIGQLKKYALHTPELCEVNMSLLATKCDTLPEEIVKVAANNLGRAAKRYNLSIPQNLQKYVGSKRCCPVVELVGINKTAYYKKLQSREVTKPASVEQEYALPEQKRYPISNKRLVKVAMSYFDQYYLDFPAEERLKFALNVASAAERFNVDYGSSHISKYASLSPYVYNENVEEHINMRKTCTTDEDLQQEYAHLAKTCRNIGVLKTAAELEKLDNKGNLTRAYGGALLDPLLSALGSVKVAMCEIDGRIITAEMIKKALSNEAAGDYIDSYTADELSGPDGLDVFASLPQPIRENLYQFMDN